MSTEFTRRQALVAIGLLGLTGRQIRAADAVYPMRPVRVIVPYGPSTGTDLLARYLAEQLTAQWKQGVIVENRTGAGGVIGTQALLNSAADGYTLGMVASTHVINGAVYSNLAFNPVEDFVWLASLASTPLVLVAPTTAYPSLKDLMAHARAAPGSINYGSVGNGSVTHLAVELLQKQGSVRLQHVPYNAPGQLTTALIGGEVTLAAMAIATALPQFKAGRLRILAICSPQRSKVLPEVPPVADEVPGYDLTPWIGLIARKGVPAEVTRQVEAGVAQVVAQRGFETRLGELGMDPQVKPGAEFASMARSDLKKWREIVAAAGIKPQ
jgi:tripartite-type tricarboxylate transporter receptor subunit TctC